jgi:hypothetical protein
MAIPNPSDGRQQLGACAFPKGTNLDTRILKTFLILLLTATEYITGCPTNMITFKKYCLNYAYKNTSQCTADGGQWLTPSTTATECLADEGCYELLPDADRYQHLIPNIGEVYQQGFSLKNQDSCLSEYNPNPNVQWKPLFNWLPGRWILPSYRPAEWKLRTTYTTYSYVPYAAGVDVFYPDQLYQRVLSTSYVLSLVYQAKSSVLCRTAPLFGAIDEFACDCNNVDSTAEECFGAQAFLPIAQLKACPNLVASSNFATGQIYTDPDSVTTIDCGNIFVSAISASVYKTVQQTKLSSNFASFREPLEYSVKNDNGQEIGSLLSDGV